MTMTMTMMMGNYSCFEDDEEEEEVGDNFYILEHGFDLHDDEDEDGVVRGDCVCCGSDDDDDVVKTKKKKKGMIIEQEEEEVIEEEEEDDDEDGEWVSNYTPSGFFTGHRWRRKNIEPSSWFYRKVEIPPGYVLVDYVHGDCGKMEEEEEEEEEREWVSEYSPSGFYVGHRWRKKRIIFNDKEEERKEACVMSSKYTELDAKSESSVGCAAVVVVVVDVDDEDKDEVQSRKRRRVKKRKSQKYTA